MTQQKTLETVEKMLKLLILLTLLLKQLPYSQCSNLKLTQPQRIFITLPKQN